MDEKLFSRPTPDLSPDQRQAAETAKLIRKLRWIGKEAEAHDLELQLSHCQLVARSSVLAEPLNTD
jgi:hypothetical protein